MFSFLFSNAYQLKQKRAKHYYYYYHFIHVLFSFYFTFTHHRFIFIFTAILCTLVTIMLFGVIDSPALSEEELILSWLLCSPPPCRELSTCANLPSNTAVTPGRWAVYGSSASHTLFGFFFDCVTAVPSTQAFVLFFKCLIIHFFEIAIFSRKGISALNSTCPSMKERPER